MEKNKQKPDWKRMTHILSAQLIKDDQVCVCVLLITITWIYPFSWLNAIETVCKPLHVSLHILLLCLVRIVIHICIYPRIFVLSTNCCFILFYRIVLTTKKTRSIIDDAYGPKFHPFFASIKWQFSTHSNATFCSFWWFAFFKSISTYFKHIFTLNSHCFRAFGHILGTIKRSSIQIAWKTFEDSSFKRKTKYFW